MYISHTRKLIYLAAPRTASRAVAQYLTCNGFVQENGHHNFTNLRQNKYASYTTFTIIRNHHDTWVSWYVSTGAGIKHADKLLLPYIRAKISTSKSWMLPHKLWGIYTPIADIVIKYESMQIGLEGLLSKQVILPVVGISERISYGPYYNTATYKWVLDNYKEEMEELGYG